MNISRRSFLKTAAAIGASLAWVEPARGSRLDWQHARTPVSSAADWTARVLIGGLKPARTSIPRR